jgi:hypothetical protein
MIILVQQVDQRQISQRLIDSVFVLMTKQKRNWMNIANVTVYPREKLLEEEFICFYRKNKNSS